MAYDAHKVASRLVKHPLFLPIQVLNWSIVVTNSDPVFSVLYGAYPVFILSRWRTVLVLSAAGTVLVLERLWDV